MTEHSPHSTGEPRHAWLGSLLCWFCLLLAAAVYAVMSLSPKLLALVLIRNEYESNQARLVELEKQVEHMGEIANALENDPAFNAAMARADFEKDRPGEERIPVESNLMLEARPAAPNLDLRNHPPPWYTPVLKLLSEDRRLGNSLATAAALLTILSFVLAPVEGSAGTPGAADSPLSALFRQLRGRYRRSKP